MFNTYISNMKVGVHHNKYTIERFSVLVEKGLLLTNMHVPKETIWILKLTAMSYLDY